MKKITKALDISPEVKRRVYERDGGLCIICGKQGAPNAHFIARSQLGLGVEENIVTLCPECHSDYDQSFLRKQYREIIKNYLKTRYSDWDEEKLIYKKG